MSGPRPRATPWLPMVLGVAVLALGVVLFWRGWSFYRLSLEARVEHPEFRTLRPSGVVGNGYGWVAALLIVLNLSYLVRRRLAAARLGPMRVWLDVHVFTGLTAAMLVTAHSALQLRTPIAMVSAASLALVVVTGLIGRFLYARRRRRVCVDAARSHVCPVRGRRGRARRPRRRSLGRAAPRRRREHGGLSRRRRRRRAGPGPERRARPATRRRARGAVLRGGGRGGGGRRGWPRCCARGAACAGSPR